MSPGTAGIFILCFGRPHSLVPRNAGSNGDLFMLNDDL